MEWEWVEWEWMVKIRIDKSFSLLWLVNVECRKTISQVKPRAAAAGNNVDYISPEAI